MAATPIPRTPTKARTGATHVPTEEVLPGPSAEVLPGPSAEVLPGPAVPGPSAEATISYQVDNKS